MNDHDDRRIERPMPSPWLRMRLPSPLPPETECVMTETIGCAITVIARWGLGSSSRFIGERCISSSLHAIWRTTPSSR